MKKIILASFAALLIASCTNRLAWMDKTPGKPMVRVYSDNGTRFYTDSATAQKITAWRDSLTKHPRTAIWWDK